MLLLTVHPSSHQVAVGWEETAALQVVADLSPPCHTPLVAGGGGGEGDELPTKLLHTQSHNLSLGRLAGYWKKKNNINDIEIQLEYLYSLPLTIIASVLSTIIYILYFVYCIGECAIGCRDLNKT